MPNFRELDEMVSWMRGNGVIHMDYEGVTLTLAEVAPIVYSMDDTQADASEEDEDDGFTTPQARIRARLHKNKAEKAPNDD